MAGRRFDFFALRAPLLPFDALEAWSEGLEAPRVDGDGPELDEALDRDRGRLRERLRAQLARPEVRGAVFVASPDLDDALSERPTPKAEAALVRYVSRMASRPTPFGLFAGCGVGTIGSETRLELPERDGWRRHTRLDADYLDSLIRALATSPELRERLPLRPNGSLRRQGGRLRYVESRLDERERSHHLVEVEDSPHLERALDAAAGGTTALQIAAAVAAGGVADAAAAAYVHDLVAAQILVPDLDVEITGAQPLDALLADLRSLGLENGAVAVLEAVREELRAIDAGGAGAAPDLHRRVATLLEELPVEVSIGRLFQVDLTIPAGHVELSQRTAEEVARGLDLAARLAPRATSGDLAAFRDAFRERYEGREVPLLEALDEELGVGFGRAGGGDPSPLLKDLPLGAPTPPEVAFGPREQHLLGLLQRSWAAGERELVLGPTDVDALAAEETEPLPDALAAIATLARTAAGPRILIQGFDGPSGARLLGRFCHADPELDAAVRRHLREEEALDPDAVFAEVVHLPSGRMANILARPVLRDWEVEWLGRSGAPAGRVLPASDLLVSLRRDRVVLRSQRLGRRVIPRLTSAHNWNRRSPGVYRFLCELQAEGRVRRGSWSWEPFGQAPFLPRVRCGRVVLACARWRLDRDELRALAEDPWRAMQALRRSRELPRRVVLADADNRLPVDLDNVLSVEAFARTVRSRDEALLEELFPAPDELVASGPDGRYAHEIVLPMVRAAPDVAPPGPRDDVVAPLATAGEAGARRVFAPGSPWTYLKLYTGTASADRLLREEIAPLVDELVGRGTAERWFFLRYADPGHHLRVRFLGDPREVRPALEAVAERALSAGLAHDAVFGTYQREIERYGGPHAIELAERLFHADSDTVVDLLGMFEPGDAGLDERWRIGLLGTHLLMAELGLGPEERLAQAVRMRDALAREHRPRPAARKRLGERFRGERAALDELLDLESDGEHPLAPGVAVLGRRSERIAPIAGELRALHAAGHLALPLEELSVSYVHMWLNRLARSANRTQEWVTYDLLARLYEARARRADERSARGAARSP